MATCSPRGTALRSSPSLAAGVLASRCTASSPKFFQAATQADFLKGDVENLSIDSRGQLVLGPATELVYETPSPFLWTVVPGADGSLFVGTGNDGRVFRVDRRATGTSFFDAAELEVHALAPAPTAACTSARSPDGKIYKVDRNGTPTTFFDPEEKYIWALATDADGQSTRHRREGRRLQDRADGKGAPFYQTKATHATALAFDRAGNLLVGTESPGACFASTPRARGSCCSTRRSRRSARCASTTRACCTSRR